MLELVIGIAIGMVLAWNVVKEQPQWVEDMYTKLVARLKS